MSVSRFRVYGKDFDGVNVATVEIDRGPMVFRVRPLRRRKVYELPLAFVAESVMWQIERAQAREKKALKEARRKLRKEARRKLRKRGAASKGG